MQNSLPLNERLATMDRRLYALFVGALVGGLGALIGIAVSYAGPIMAAGALVGILGGVYILTDVRAALYGTLAIMLIFPFGTLPFKIILTPTLLDMTLGSFVVVYLLQWMTGKRHTLTLTPIHLLVLVYLFYFILAFAIGLRWGAPTPNIIRQFSETLLAIGLVFIIVDITKDSDTLRRLVLLILLLASLQALMAIVLWVMPDAFSERQLIRLARIGYPNGGVIRYVEDNRALAERAIGTWVDPNVLGGALAIFASIITPQIFARKPVIRQRWLTFCLWCVVVVAVLLTFSRAALVGFVAGGIVIALMRYRKLLAVMAIGGVLLLFLPQTQFYVERFISAFGGANADPATLMRYGEYTDSIRLIQQYPWFGVGFTGTPSRNLYTHAASMYLIMANQTGLIGLGLFLLLMGSVIVYGWQAWQRGKDNDDLNAILLGYYAGLVTALTSGLADLYFFRLDFQSPITLFWLTVALCLATARLCLEAKDTPS
ncbi:MAG: O-antigen ligase family protein [Phototrophicaceae bacterium]